MGVRGLTTYINNRQDFFFKQYHLHDTSLVIDGLNLCAQLYRSLNTFSAFGGDYNKIALFIKTFFKNLRKCNVTPYVIFDGCHETRKLKTVLSRLRNKLKGTSKLDAVTQNNLLIFPYMLRDVFKEILVELKISYTICEFEADEEIAALARYLNCPVLSYDSDFYIYNVLYIPFNTLETKPIQIELNGTKVSVMECKLYKVQYLCDYFGGLHEELLPLLATVLGNDFVEKRVFSKFFEQLKLPKRKNVKNDEQRQIHALFKWLQNETLDSAIIKILGRLKKDEKNKVKIIIKKSIDGYYCQSCKSMKYLNLQTDNLLETYDFKDGDEIDNFDEVDNFNEGHGSDEGIDDDKEKARKISTSSLKSLPDWFANKIRKNLIPTCYLNLYVHHLHICNPQPEDFTDKDTFLSVIKILRYAFDILTDFSQDKCLYYSRENDCYHKFTVGRDYSVERPFDIPYEHLTDTQLKQYFGHFLSINLQNLDFTLIKQLPSNFQLFIISILWWVQNCSVPDAHVQSVIMSYIMLQVINEKTGTEQSYYHFNNKHANKLVELRHRAATQSIEIQDYFLDKNKVQYPDCLLAASVLLKHYEINESIQKKPRSYDIKKIHSFAQFQCALQQINALNILCTSPFESTVFYKSYNGTFIYNIALMLERQEDPVATLEQHIKGATTVIMFYKSINKIYNELLQKMNLSTVKWSHKRQKSRWN